MTAAVSVRPGRASDLPSAMSWLTAAGLPTEDLTPEHMQSFLVALIDQRPVGMIGLETFDRVGLLRSLVVDPASKKQGIGEQLVVALESRAAELGIKELWLLTIDADAYFSRFGYSRAERDEAPVEIRNTEEFLDLCPADAVLMRKSL